MLISRLTTKSPKTLRKGSTSKCQVPLTSCANFSTFKPKHSGKRHLDIFQCLFQGLSVYFNNFRHDCNFFLGLCLSRIAKCMNLPNGDCPFINTILSYLFVVSCCIFNTLTSLNELFGNRCHLEKKRLTHCENGVQVIFYIISVLSTYSSCQCSRIEKQSKLLC